MGPQMNAFSSISTSARFFTAPICNIGALKQLAMQHVWQRRPVTMACSHQNGSGDKSAANNSEEDYIEDEARASTSRLRFNRDRFDPKTQVMRATAVIAGLASQKCGCCSKPSIRAGST